MTAEELIPNFAFEDWPNFYAAQIWVSHFPKSMKDEDFGTSPFMYFGAAKSKNLVEDFLLIESNFLQFYRELVADGPVFLNHFHGRNPFTGEYRVKRFAHYNQKFERLIRRQIREQVKLGQFDDMYIPSQGVHVWFNHDMTHVIFVEAQEKEATITKMAAACNLHILK